jgi:DNA adenine methylase
VTSNTMAAVLRVDAPPPAKPFLKWAGGKRQLLPELLKHVPPHFDHYYEPFVGGGALFFALQPQPATLGDSNLHLIAAYKGVRDNVEDVIKFLALHAKRHNKTYYYATRAALVDTSTGRPVGALPNVAARVIYINRTCFNGLWRVNKAGGYNVPMGDYKNPAICDAVGLRACSRALQGVTLVHKDFAETVADAEKGDFVYFDPPYAPTSGTADFVSYTRDGFDGEDQWRLRDVAFDLKRRGVGVLLSNADTPGVRKVYRSGFEMRRVEAKRAINSKADRRGAVGELLIW